MGGRGYIGIYSGFGDSYQKRVGGGGGGGETLPRHQAFL